MIQKRYLRMRNRRKSGIHVYTQMIKATKTATSLNKEVIIHAINTNIHMQL